MRVIRFAEVLAMAVLISAMPFFAWACPQHSCGSPTQNPGHDAGSTPAQSGGSPSRTVDITVDGGQFRPAQVHLKHAETVRLVFHRTAAPTCATEVQIPSLGVKAVPLSADKTTTIDITPQKPGRYVFSCKMNMIKGELLVH